jgi:DNA (cytosine-5)-methyltransferase 1
VRIGSLFSGAGGLDMAVEAVFGGHTVWHSEIDKAASKVLAHRWPDVTNLGSITEIDWATVEPVDVLCGGFPCTDVSAAGKRAGMHGTRSGLWSEFAKAIDILRPRMVVIENVRGLLSAHANRPMESDDVSVGDGGTVPVLRAAGAVLGDLADLGYNAQWTTLAAASVGAPHRRERVFIVAHADGGRCFGCQEHDRSQGCAPPDRSAELGHISRCGDQDGVGHRTACCDADGVRQKWWGDASDTSRIGWHEGRPESAGLVGGSDAAVGGDADLELLPTPCAQQSGNTPENHLAKKPGRNVVTDLAILVENGLLESGGALLPTPKAHDGMFGSTARTSGRPIENATHLQTIACLNPTSWGKYEPAIKRWEQIVGPAPAPTEPNKNGNPRLSAAFSEWLMGWPAGWVTDPAIGISRNDQLRIVGNGVCSQQAAAALRQLLAVTA